MRVFFIIVWKVLNINKAAWYQSEGTELTCPTLTHTEENSRLNHIYTCLENLRLINIWKWYRLTEGFSVLYSSTRQTVEPAFDFSTKN